MRVLNLGILAHVDAGKTSLTERLLYTAGVIGNVGSVDEGTTQTDSLDLERQRGITIRAAVVSFTMDGTAVNLIDTPGHPDFIAEVERALAVLDGAILVVSAVEGVQAQTHVLMRVLRRLRIPTLIFVNKIDRAGADPDRVLRQVTARLPTAPIAMGTVANAGTPNAAFNPHRIGDRPFTATLLDAVSQEDDRLLTAYVQDEASVSDRHLQRALAAQVEQAVIHPTFFGSAATGAGVDALVRGVLALLPASAGAANAPLSGMVFKVERGRAGDKVAYVRLRSGTLRVRDRVPFDGRAEGRVTAIRVFADGTTVSRPALTAGEIGRVWGLTSARVGDRIGAMQDHAATRMFAPPTLEATVVPTGTTEKGALRAALALLAEQDPLINLRQDDTRQELFVSLYGEVQKEVIEATLATEFGLTVEFRDTTVICVERPVGIGEAIEVMRANGNPFLATVALRVEAATPGSGISFRLAPGLAGVPLYVYRSAEEFERAMAEVVRESLAQGLDGWPVTDCVVTMTHSGYSSPATSAADFRKLTPLVLMAALEQAGTVVCEPVHRFRLECPVDSVSRVLPALSRCDATPTTHSAEGVTAVLEGHVPAASIHALQQQLPGLTHGEGLLECAFDRYEPVRGPKPTRARTDLNPLHRAEYLMRVQRRTST